MKENTKSNNLNTATYGFTVAVLYGVISIAITFFNKAVLSVYDFPFSNTLTLGQMLFSLLFLVLAKKLRLIDYPDFSLETAKKLYSLALYFFAMVVTGLAAMRFMNVPMYSAVRRLTTLIVMWGEFYLLGKVTAYDESLSVYGMILGAIVAGIGDLTFNFIGYTLCILNCFVTAIYLIYIAKKKNETDLNTFGLMFYNNLFGIPLVALVVAGLELDGILSSPLWFDTGFLICFLTSSVQAFLLNYFIFLCSTVNSPLTTSVTGQIKNVVTTGIGLFIFGDVEFSMLLNIGLFIATAASVWYSYIKYVQTANRSSHAKQEKENSKV
eukprot:TRINITY_DN993_c0_g1_i1.p1 TRINITY_DN993_c0_g1~~TRINITY_DN993_c0_g1_i1.p1  ORF type:complete len:325 (-),score=30.16 TRINITY_DN993_c0_g1_i1:46-1020(-)